MGLECLLLTRDSALLSAIRPRFSEPGNEILVRNDVAPAGDHATTGFWPENARTFPEVCKHKFGRSDNFFPSRSVSNRSGTADDGWLL